jgi:(1->4)-alpha-D-glucan 1-alpha-D-glucosylmutase
VRLISSCLRIRQRFPGLFVHGDYRPAKVSGSRARNIVAFFRRQGNIAALVAVPRQAFGACGSEDISFDPDWFGNTTVEHCDGGNSWICALTGARHAGAAAFPVATLLARQPISILVSHS